MAFDLDGRYFCFADNCFHDQLPHPSLALSEPDGLLAAGGSLEPEHLLLAYRAGVFPWFNSDQEAVLWWSPDPRTVIDPQQIKISRSLAKRLRSPRYSVTIDTRFKEVMGACAAPRRGSEGTWITERMRQAYRALHELGYAHSVEVWENQNLVGGLYGVSLGGLFFGESMFSRQADASKVALVRLSELLRTQGIELIDCQVASAHLYSLGAFDLPRTDFLKRLQELLERPDRRGMWDFQ